MTEFYLSSLLIVFFWTVRSFDVHNVMSFVLLFFSGSVYRDEFDLAILKLQEDNRLEILKRKWWDGGKCPKEEDHRAKGFYFSFFLTSS